MCDLPNSDRPQFHLHPAVVRRNDTSAKSINEWTREKTLRCCSSFLHPCDPQLAMWNLYYQRTCCWPVLCYQALADSVHVIHTLDRRHNVWMLSTRQLVQGF